MKILKANLFVIIFSLLLSADFYAQDNGTLIIYNSANFGINTFKSKKFINSGIKDVLIQLGKYNYTQSQNESGRYLKLNKSGLLWYIPYNGSINPAWGVYIFSGTYDCQPIPFFAISSHDSNRIIKFVITPAADCPDANTYCTVNSGTNYFYTPFGCGGGIIFPNGSDYNPKNNNELLFGYCNSNCGIFKSTNAGQNWFLINAITGLRQSSDRTDYLWIPYMYGFIKYNPFDTAFVYANGINNVFISTNGGYNFSSSSVKWFKDIVFSYKDSVIYGYNDNKLYRSYSKGLNWDSVQTNIYFTVLEINPDFPNILYGGDSIGIHISTNYGNNWTLYNNSFQPARKIIGISKDEGSGDTLYAATTQNVYKVWASFLVGVNKAGKTLPEKYDLYQNYPNPFNPTTKIKFDIPNGQPKTDNVQLIIYDILGREVTMLVNEQLKPGTYEVTFNAGDLPSGIYFYQLKSENFIETKKLILLK